MSNRFTGAVGLATVLATSTVTVQGQQDARAAAPTAESYDGLTFHKAPKPLASGAKTEDWPQFLGPRRNGHSLETPLLLEWPKDGPSLVWSMRCGQGYASPAIRGKRLVYPHRVGNRAHIDCLDADTGKRFWRVSYECNYRGRYISDSGPRATPLIEGDRVWVHGVENVLHCLELATGKVVWKRDLAAELEAPEDFFGVVSSPLIWGDLLIQNVGAPNGHCVVAFDKNTGKIVWKDGKSWGPSCASPMLAEVHGRTRVFVLAGGKSRPPTGGLLVLDPKTGKIEVEHPFRARIFESVTGSSPVVGDNWVFLTSSYGLGSSVLSLKEDGGFDVRWKSRRLGLQFQNAVLVDGHLYAVDGRSDRAGALVCIDPKDGKELMREDIYWDETVERDGAEKKLPFSIGEGSLIYADGHFFCLGDNGHLLSIRATPKGAKVVSRTWLVRARQSWTPPVISRGLLYVCQNWRERYGNGVPRLFCYDLRKASR